MILLKTAEGYVGTVSAEMIAAIQARMAKQSADLILSLCFCLYTI